MNEDVRTATAGTNRVLIYDPTLRDGHHAVRHSLDLMQKIFLVRQCEDSYFRNRSRPCLQYQIRRCSAPCVNLISAQDYQDSVRHAAMFLQGRSSAVIDELGISGTHRATLKAIARAMTVRVK